MATEGKKTKSSKSKSTRLVVSKENLLYQPWRLIKSGYDATAFQQNVIISVLRKLKNSLADMREGYIRGGEARQLSLFETEDASIFREEDDAMTFNIHMRELGVEPQNYLRAFNAVCNIGDIDVWVPVPNPDGGPEELERAKLFTIIVNKEDVIVDENNQVIGYKYQKHNPQIKLKLRHNVAETLFKGQIHTFLEDTAMNISEKFPKRLYMYFANYKNIGEISIDYWKFRQQIGFEDHNPEKPIQYPKFFDFRKRVLDPSVEKLREMAEKGQAEYWFEYEAIYKGTGRAKAPDTLKFTIHLSQIGEDYEKQKGSFRERRELEERLSRSFDQTTAQIRRLITALNAEDYEDFNRKLDELERHIEKNRSTIKDKKAYANRVLTDFISDSKEVAKAREELERQKENSLYGTANGEATDRELLIDDDAVSIVLHPAIDNSNGLISVDDIIILNNYFSKLEQDEDRKIVVPAIKLLKTDKGYCMYIPSQSTYQTFEPLFNSIINDINDELDTDVSLRLKSV